MGGLIIGGTTRSVVPSGQIELIRGNFDILGRRLALTKGIVTLQGDLTPYIEFESSASTSDGTATIEIAGTAGFPGSRCILGPRTPRRRGAGHVVVRQPVLGAFAVYHRANGRRRWRSSAVRAVTPPKGCATLPASTQSISARPRAARVALGAGAYLSDNLYTDFTVNTEGDTEVNLNLDVNDNFTVRGTVDGRGETGIGLFFERDY